MIQNLQLQHERVDDLPLIFGLISKLCLPQLIDECIGTHGAQQGLSNGDLCAGWLMYILSQGDHRKYAVEQWARQHQHTLQTVLQQPIRPVEFCDDRLGNLLRRLSRDDDWHRLEARLWQQSFEVYDVSLDAVRIDSTAVSGYHAVANEQLMQHGYNSSSRSDLPQMKLMMAMAQPSALPLATDTIQGNRADAALYLPLIERTRRLVNRSGLLYVGDSKMASLAVRTDLVAHGEYYLTRLPQTMQQPAWIDRALSAEQPLELIYRDGQLVGAGFEFTRQLSAEYQQQTISWQERVQLMRSTALAQKHYTTLLRRLGSAEQELWKLTPAPGPGRRQYREPAQLQQAITRILDRHQAHGLLRVGWIVEEPAPSNRRGKSRLRISNVEREADQIERQRWRLGWVVQVSNLGAERATLQQCLNSYRDGWPIERNFHLLKSQPLGIAPLYVQREDQIIGLSRLLMLGLRLLALFEHQVRQGLAETQQQLAGLYPGQPNAATARPTAQAMLSAVARTELTVTTIEIGQQRHRHLTPLPDLLLTILKLLHIDQRIYLDLALIPHELP